VTVRKSTYAWLGVVATVGAVAMAVPALAADDALLPDLRQAPVGCTAGYDGDPGACTDWDVCAVADASKPSGSCVTTGPIQAVRLRFTSSEENVGAGPLLLYGHRASTASPTMAVRQAFQTGEGGPIPASFAEAQHPTGATTYYEPAAMHRHWHLLDFDRFQLRNAAGSVVVTDRKNGFCLGDRYPVSGEAQAQEGTPQGDLAALLVDSTCKRRIPEALDVTEGISSGQGDNYDYTVDYQWLELTKVPSGTYTVVNTVNPDRSITESDYGNNSSSMTVSVQWPGGGAAPSPITAPPVVKMLRSCPGTASCPA
jgi:Lysyl oxidase